MEMTNSQLTNRRAELDEAIEWNTEKYQNTKYWENQQHFVEQLRSDAASIDAELARRAEAK